MNTRLKLLFSHFLNCFHFPKKEASEHLKKELKEYIKKLPAINIDNGTGADLAWNRYLLELRKSILTQNIDDFINWPVIQKSMFYKARAGELEYLKSRKDWLIWEKAIKESSVGRPPKYPGMMETSGNLIHQAYSLAQYFENIEDIRIMDDILEVGGGYGSMARLVHNLEFTGKYTILDFSEFLAIQKYYLEMSKIKTDDSIKFTDKINCIENKNPDLLIGLWSISETPEKFRDELFSYVHPRNYLIAYQTKFEEVDNTSYFQKLTDKERGLTWDDYTVPAFQSTLSRYLIGKSNGK